MTNYINKVIDKVKEINKNEPEFIQAVEEVLNSIKPSGFRTFLYSSRFPL